MDSRGLGLNVGQKCVCGAEVAMAEVAEEGAASGSVHRNFYDGPIDKCIVRIYPKEPSLLLFCQYD